MTDYLTASGIGARIKAARKQRGMRSMPMLAEAIDTRATTTAVLMNIEAGRKSDLPISELLNIAMALKIAPVFLLAPVGRPSDQLDLPNLSKDFDGMTVSQFDAWLSGEPDGAYAWSRPDEREERLQLHALRELDRLSREQRRLAAAARLEQATLGDSTNETQPPWRSFEAQLEETNNRIDQLRDYLRAAGWRLEGWGEN